MESQFLPNKASISGHEIPKWYHDAKLGIFIHWGLYSVPGWAIKELDFQEALKKHGATYWFRNNAYAEWYWNSLKIQDSATQAYHKARYGDAYRYEDFKEDFEREVESFHAEEWGELFKHAGARYAILTSKHHDGYLLWNSRHPNPIQPDFQSKRDLLGEFTDAMRGADIRVGLYYSGGPDWVFEPHPIESLVDLMTYVPQSDTYANYVIDHYLELIDRYQPDILWNDISFPQKADLYSLLATFYNQNPEGVVNDRFSQMQFGGMPNNKFTRNMINRVIEGAIKRGVDILGSNKPPKIGDYSTPEYTQLGEISSHKWETCRGLGKSFGYNRLEEDSDLISSQDLIQLLVDIVSKNGNLLLNVGPKANGSIPEIQKKRLLALGDWLKGNGEAIFGTRPWITAEGSSLEGIPLRFTQKNGKVYAFTMAPLQGDRLRLAYSQGVKNIRLLGTKSAQRFKHDQNILEIDISASENLKDETVKVYCIE